MNFDPLADVSPPRYAIESDDEDEDEGNLGHPQIPSSNPKRNIGMEVTFKPEENGQEMEKHVHLIVASGQAGSILARLLGRPSISSRVYVNSIEVFSLFSFPISPHSLTTR